MSEARRWRLARRDILRVGAGLALGGAAASGDAKKPALRFGLLTDPHYADRAPAGSRHYRDSLAKLRACVAEFNRQGLDFALENGDFKDEDATPDEARTLRYLETIEAEFKKFKGPRYHTLGNHDLDSISKAQFLARVENTGVAKDRSYYAFSRGGVRFIVLDANHTSKGEDYNKGNFTWTDCNIPESQMAWLTSELAAGDEPVVAFCHQRLDGSGEHFVNNAATARAAFEASGRVMVVFQGHDHRGADQTINGVRYYTVKAMVEQAGLDHNSFAVVAVHPGERVVVEHFTEATR